MENKNLFVLPGGGSPHNKYYKEVYNTIKFGEKKYGYNVTILDYSGCGQFPDYGKGLSLPSSVLKVTDTLNNAPKNSTLMARCYGCNVLIYILANEPEILNSFSKIVLWSVALNEVWDDLCTFGVKNWNIAHEKKGVQLAEDYCDTLNNVEKDVQKIKHNNIIFGYGTKDNITSKAFNEKLANIINKNGGNAQLFEIKEADHVIISKVVDTSILNEYYKLIFEI